MTRRRPKDSLFYRPRRSPDPIAPVRKRPRRIAKKLAKRWGMQRYRGFSATRWMRITKQLGTDMAESLNRIVKRMAAGEEFAGYRIQDGKLVHPPRLSDRYPTEAP